MSFRGRSHGRPVRLAGATLLLPGALLMGAMASARGQEDPPQAPAGLVPGTRAGAGSGMIPDPPGSAGGLVGRPPGAPDERTTSPPPEIKYSGTPTPGARITVGLDGPPEPEATYHWVQIEGPPVTIDDETKPKIQVTVPPNAQSLGFLMTSRDARGQRTARFTIPILQHGADRPSPATLRADAGDDQIGLVGRRITLNGSRSTPREGVVYRWFQLAGSKVEQAAQESSYFMFTPTMPGVYRFGLVVASANPSTSVSISELDEVLVTVGELPSAFGGNAVGGVTSGFSTAALDQMLQGPGSIATRATLDQVAGVLEAISERSLLYTTFADLTSEMMRRLDGVMPTDPNARQYWIQGIFGPMTQHIVAEMLSVGLDLRVPQAQYQGLSPLHQDKLQKLLSYYSREFQSRTQAR